MHNDAKARRMAAGAATGLVAAVIAAVLWHYLPGAGAIQVVGSPEYRALIWLAELYYAPVRLVMPLLLLSSVDIERVALWFGMSYAGPVLSLILWPLAGGFCGWLVFSVHAYWRSHSAHETISALAKVKENPRDRCMLIGAVSGLALQVLLQVMLHLPVTRGLSDVAMALCVAPSIPIAGVAMLLLYLFQPGTEWYAVGLLWWYGPTLSYLFWPLIGALCGSLVFRRRSRRQQMGN